MPIRKLLIVVALGLTVLTGCKSGMKKSVGETDDMTPADSLIQVVGDTRDIPRLLAVIDSVEKRGELTLAKSIFYRTVAYNMQGEFRSSFELYNLLADIDVKGITDSGDLECYIYSYDNYVRLLCDMKRYDAALRESYAVDRKLREAGQASFIDRPNIARTIGDCQLNLGQTEKAAASYQRALRSIRERLATYKDPLDYRECQQTITAIAMAYIHAGYYAEAVPWMTLQDSMFEAAQKHPHRDSVYVDEMKAEISYCKALLAEAQGRDAFAERAYQDYLSTNTAKSLGNVINGSEFLMKTHRYSEAADNYSRLDQFMQESGTETNLENIGRYMLPKYRANLLAGRKDSALNVAIQIAEAYDSALIRQKLGDAAILSTVFDTEGKERQIAEQRAELSHQREVGIGVGLVLIVLFFGIYTISRRQAYHKLDATNRELLIAKEKAEESARMKSKFIKQISHEVRTPLNVLSGFTQVLTAPDIELSGEDLQSINHKIVENSERITKLVDKMLDLSEVNNFSIIECQDTVVPAEIADQAIEKSGIREAVHLKFVLMLMPHTETESFITNCKSAVKALTLLLDNAIKFTRPVDSKVHLDTGHQARVTLQVNVQKKKVLFIVEDTGIGVPPEEAEHIFEEFVQLDEYYDGTGIGLSIARSLARHMKGDVLLDTAYTGGARFVLTLPLKTHGSTHGFDTELQ